MKKRLSLCIAAALGAAVLFGGNAEAADKVSYDNLGRSDAEYSGIFASGKGEKTEDMSNVSKVAGASESQTVFGVLATDNAVLKSSNEGNINIYAENTDSTAPSGGLPFSAVGVAASAFSSNQGYADGGTVQIGEKGKTKDINISVTSKKEDTFASGINAVRIISGDQGNLAGPSKVVVSGDNLEINVVHNAVSGAAVGIFAQNNTGNPADPSSVTIDTENTVINLQGSATFGIRATSNGIIDIKSNLLMKADTAIMARGDAQIDVNSDGKHTTQIYGDMNFAYTGTTGVDAKVNLNLTGKDSVWEGNSLVSGNASNPDLMKVNGFHVDINDGAQWITDGNSFVNTLSMDGGIINMVGDDTQTLDLYTVDGSGTVNMNTEKTADGFSAGTLNVNSVAADKTARLGVNFMGINADDIKDAKTDMASLASHVEFGTNGQGIDEKQMTATANVGEGLIKGAISAGMVTDTSTGGTGNIVEGSIHQNSSTTTMENMKNIAAVSIAAWRQEDSTLSQRLGDLRETTGGQGIWARVSRGEFEYSGEFKNQYNYFQIGWDMAKDDWHYGAAVSYNDGETTYSDGNGENSSTSLSLYGTRLLNDGQYFDIVLKAGRLNNKYDNYAAAGHTHGDYDAWGTEISGEYGKKIDLANDWFVTPQAQLSLMRIGSEDYTTSNGIHVDQDTLYSAVGRIGAEAGKKTAWGSLYAKASVLHDFAGDADTYLTYQGLSNSYSQDIGDTWYEAGFGANWKMSDSSYLYVDVIRTFGGDIKTPWQWNAGVRWGF